MTQSFVAQAEAWGKVYEILIKRGVLGCLVHADLVDGHHPRLEPWRRTSLYTVKKALLEKTGILDGREWEIMSLAFEHLAFTAYGSGYTLMREYLKSRSPKGDWKNVHKKLSVRKLWCPLVLPDRDYPENDDDFYAGLPLGIGSFDKGTAAHADFLLWLDGDGTDHILVQEYSFDAPSRIYDFSRQEEQLEELRRYWRIHDARSVFAGISAETVGEGFEVSNLVYAHLNTLSAKDKPLYKLAQACSYATHFADILVKAMGRETLLARALAVTPNGVESLGARFAKEAADHKAALMRRLGTAYRNAEKPESEEELLGKTRLMLRKLAESLPEAMRKPAMTLEDRADQDFTLEFREEVGDFCNPMSEFRLEEAKALIQDTPELNEWLGGPAGEVIIGEAKRLAGSDTVTLRNLHAAAVIAALKSSRPGRINVLALEGNPGIGKTTAVKTFLAENRGFLFVYLSPRVVINRDVARSLAQNPDGSPSGVLTLTSSFELNASAKDRYRKAQGAVVAEGVPGITPDSGERILGGLAILSSEKESEVCQGHGAATFKVRRMTEDKDRVSYGRQAGVLAALSSTARLLLEENPAIDRVAMVCAVQGYRETYRKTTIDSLSRLFEFPKGAKETKVLEEREKIAGRIRHVIVMVDELAGDEAGAPFFHAIAGWLDDEFISPFNRIGEKSPFIITLIASDASLTNDFVMTRYLESGEETPDRVYVCGSSEKTPFRVSMRALQAEKTLPVLHVMANSFPADSLSVHYKVRMERIQASPQESILKTAQKAYRAQQIGFAVEEISRAIGQNARQVIYFAQDKELLGDLKKALVNTCNLADEEIGVLDSSVSWEKRKELIRPEMRDSIRVFLMTSSGSRGISFPRADWIIASMPRFRIESALMEITQLIYRGRGSYLEGDRWVSGDTGNKTLVMLIGDFRTDDSAHDTRQWLRNAVNLITLLLLLRASIFTRITGASGLRQSLAVIPVGASRIESAARSIAENSKEFVRGVNEYIANHPGDSPVGLLRETLDEVKRTFKDFALLGITSVSGTLFDEKKISSLRSETVGGLLLDHPEVPDFVYFCGPLIIEDWSVVSGKMEGHDIKGNTEQQKGKKKNGDDKKSEKKNDKLLGMLKEISGKRQLSWQIRTAATNFAAMIRDDGSFGYSVLREDRTKDAWLVLPAGYDLFCGKAETVPDREAYEEQWYRLLSRCFSNTVNVIPPFPVFDRFPWAGRLGKDDPVGLSRVFDDRYLAASSELNMLNALLLHPPQE